jgi:hypothetical protein
MSRPIELRGFIHEILSEGWLLPLIKLRSVCGFFFPPVSKNSFEDGQFAL